MLHLLLASASCRDLGVYMVPPPASVTPPAPAESESEDSQTSPTAAPYEQVLRRVVDRIREEPFLFVVAIGILLVGLATLTTDASDLRFIVVCLVLVVLAFAVLGGYYFREARKEATASINTPIHKGESKTKAKVNEQSARRFWGRFANDDFSVVVGRFRKEFERFEASGFLGVGDAIGLTELGSFLGSLHLADFSVMYADRLDGDDLQANLLILGGPDANSIANQVVKRLNTTFELGDPQKYEIAIRDAKLQETYAPRIDSGSEEVVTDYAVIYWTKNPFSPDKWMLLIAGSFGFGTWAGTRFVMSKDFLDNAMVKKGKSVECLVETDVVLGAPQRIRVIGIREMEAV
jgi:hypothetical protein